MVSSAMGLKLGVFRFLLTTHASTNTKQMRRQSLQRRVAFSRVYLHAQTAVDAGDICTWRTTVILITGKTWRLPIWTPCWDKNGTCSGISSSVYLWYLSLFFNVMFLDRPHRTYIGHVPLEEDNVQEDDSPRAIRTAPSKVTRKNWAKVRIDTSGFRPPPFLLRYPLLKICDPTLLTSIHLISTSGTWFRQ